MYLVFAGDDYYPAGGMSDLILETASRRLSIEFADSHMVTNQGGSPWAHVYDTSAREGIHIAKRHVAPKAEVI